MKKNIIAALALALCFGFASTIIASAGDDVKGKAPRRALEKTTATQAPGKNGDAYRMNINNVNLPMNRKGIIAAVNIAPDGSGGKFANKVFLFSGGFFLSGKKNGNLWANAVASASLVEDYVHGPVATMSGANQTDPRAQIYALSANEKPFDKGWQDWKDAVALGADFYDGDGDGQYTPVDKNGNGKWDANEDAPDLLGDETVWTVYNDGLPAAQRRWNAVDPLGIEVRQTVFAFASAGPLGNIVFVRYRFKYTGLNRPDDPAKLDSVYFGVWADPDLGDHNDDLVGCDALRNAGFVYNKTADAQYGNQPPCFLIDFFSGPVAYIKGVTYTDVNTNDKYDAGVDIALDTAFSYRGQLKGIVKLPGAKNLGINSFVCYRNGDPDLRDPDTHVEARNYMLGFDRKGNPINVCTFTYGNGSSLSDCGTINNRLWFSGDPVTQSGWLCTAPTDVRMMQNTGPFELEKGVEKEVVVAYVVGQGQNPLGGVAKAKDIDDGAQFIFSQNFAAPSPPRPVDEALGNFSISRGENFIDLTWTTNEQVGYNNVTSAYELKFKGFRVFSFATGTLEETVNGLKNKYEIAKYDLNNFIKDIYKQNLTTGGLDLLYTAADSAYKLDPAIYSNPATGKIRIRLTKDPITGNELVKGKPYYFAITSYGVNYKSLTFKSDPTKPVGTVGDYYLSANAFVAEVENIPKIFTVVLGEDSYQPPTDTTFIGKSFSNGRIVYDVIDKSKLTGDQYKVSFYPDSSSATYSAFWRLDNVTKGTKLVDSSKQYLYGDGSIAYKVTDGFILRTKNLVPSIGTLKREITSDSLFKSGVKFHYMNKDATGFTNMDAIGGTIHNTNPTFVRADRLRRVEVRFGETSNAYRYLNGFKGTSAFQKNASFVFAEAVLPADTVGRGAIPASGWDAGKNAAKGIIEVPFSAWVKDFNTNETRRLAVAVIEKAPINNGKPDGVWEPDSIPTTGEYILIFDQDYDPACGSAVHKGSTYLAPTAPFADLRGGISYNLSAVAGVSARDKAIAASPFFNVLYAVAAPKKPGTLTAGNNLILQVGTYPYTVLDNFTFQTKAGGALTADEKKALFDKVNVFPNPLYGFNPGTSYSNTDPDETYVTFSNLPEPVTIKIYSLSGTLVRTLTSADKASAGSPFLRWNLQNEQGLRIASGLYIAIVSSPDFGEKILKFSIIMPQKQLQKY